ncbi:hypothetical protein [Stenomitos frigidus]|uniref:Uncharacterized protein n=1 Tax=Stenomitos frigidus ULC18 TaxID=2107698 RepID=A0A2T1DXN5_9CYAN|nr:hypothetical protein [Stenomitos frigidus]PSB25257.1 hypothetical protein C7B82_24105 [Stenomitos frigidus ULC18]
MPSDQKPASEHPAASVPTNVSATPSTVPAKPPVPTSSSPGVSTQPLSSTAAAQAMPLREPKAIDISRFNALVGDWQGQPVTDLKRLFTKQVILDDTTTLEVETITVPGYIGITDAVSVTDPAGNTVSGHADIAKFLARDGLLICTYQWHKERYGVPIDTRKPLEPELFQEAFIKNEGHHAGAIVPAQRVDQTGKLIDSFGTFNEPNDYHRGMYGKDGFVAVAQRLVFPTFVTPEQARGYTNSIINWMAVLNPFAQFPKDYNGGDPTHVSDRVALKEFLKNGLLACIGDPRALTFFNDPANKTYCAEFMFISLNTPLYPFNLKTITSLLDGDSFKAKQVMGLKQMQNSQQANLLSQKTSNPEFKGFHISMPPVPEDLPPLDVLMAQNRQTIAPNSLPLPPFKISQVIRRAFRTLLPREKYGDHKLVDAQARLFKFMKPALLQQLGLESLPASDPKVVSVGQFVDQVSDQLDESYNSYAEFDTMVDGIMQKADEMLIGAGDREYFVPPRIYVDLGQNDGDDNLPQGWGFKLETVGALVARSIIRG